MQNSDCLASELYRYPYSGSFPLCSHLCSFVSPPPPQCSSFHLFTVLLRALIVEQLHVIQLQSKIKGQGLLEQPKLYPVLIKIKYHSIFFLILTKKRIIYLRNKRCMYSNCTITLEKGVKKTRTPCCLFPPHFFFFLKFDVAMTEIISNRDGFPSVDHRCTNTRIYIGKLSLSGSHLWSQNVNIIHNYVH